MNIFFIPFLSSFHIALWSPIFHFRVKVLSKEVLLAKRRNKKNPKNKTIITFYKNYWWVLKIDIWISNFFSSCKIYSFFLFYFCLSCFSLLKILCSMYFLIIFLHGVFFLYFCPAFLPFTFSCLRNVISSVVFFKRPTNLSRARFSPTIKKQQLTLLLYANDCLKLFLLFPYYTDKKGASSNAVIMKDILKLYFSSFDAFPVKTVGKKQ